MTILIDIGCNLSSPRLLPSVAKIRDNAHKAGVIAQILTGSDHESNSTSFELTQIYPDFFSTVGFHPHHAEQWLGEKDKLILEKYARLERVVAVGEMGLDYFRSFAEHKCQQKCFIDQLEVACSVKKPIFLHEREAFDDFCRILTPYLSKISRGVWHCFTGNQYQLEWALDMGLQIGITGWICDPIRGAGLREIVHTIPDNRLMLETDAPYLAPKTLIPVPKVNMPQYLPEVLRVVAECRKQDIAYVAKITTENAQTFFDLPSSIYHQKK